MGLSCVTVPQIKTADGKTANSILFMDLSNLVGRESAKIIWSIANTKDLISNIKNLEYDKNGEPTAASLLKNIDSSAFVDEYTHLQAERLKENAIDGKGKVIYYNDPSTLITNAIKYNETSKDYCAVVNKNNEGFYLTISNASGKALDAAMRLPFQKALSDKIENWMAKLGFGIARVSDNSTYLGRFNPLAAETTAEGLRKVVEIVHGIRGEEALPEEFSHIIIEGTRYSPLTTRLLNLMSDDVVHEILGSNYNIYEQMYDGDFSIMQREAAAQLLGERLSHPDNLSRAVFNLVNRLWNWIKSKFSSTPLGYVENLMEEAKREADVMVGKIESGDIFPEVNTEFINNSRLLYSLQNKTSKMESVAQRALELSVKRLSLMQTDATTGNNDTDLKEFRINVYRQKKAVEARKYYSSVVFFLEDALQEIQTLHSTLSNKRSEDTRAMTSIEEIRSLSSKLRVVKQFVTAYKPIIDDLKVIGFTPAERADIGFSEDEFKTINDTAYQIDRLITEIDTNYNRTRFDVVLAFLRKYWGEDKFKNIGKDKTARVSLEECLTMAKKDLGFCDRLISSLGDASDPILSVVDKAVKMIQSKRDSLIMGQTAQIAAINKRLADAGHTDTSFMYVMKDGVPTGNLISPYDFDKYYKARKAYRESLVAKGYDWIKTADYMQEWERLNTKLTIVEPQSGREEMVPFKKDSSGNNIYASHDLDKLDTAQRRYYDEMLAIKARMDNLLPGRHTRLFRAMMISKTMLQGISDNISNPKEAARVALLTIKNRFVGSADDTQFGETAVDPDTKKVVLGFDSKLVQKLPVYYTSRLEHMELLNTDFTFGMTAYTGMAIDYYQMSSVIDVLELTRDVVSDRDVQVEESGKPLMETIKAAGMTINKPYMKPGQESEIKKRLDDYYKRVIYKQSDDDTSINFFGSKIKMSKLTDEARAFVGLTGLGFNVFSGLSNAFMGNVQMVLEAIGGQYFNKTDLASAELQYWKLIPEVIKEINAPIKTAKLGLLIDKFDVLEDYYENLRRAGYYGSALERIIGNANTQFMMGMGEHYLHVKTMLAMMRHNKVLYNNKKISLYDAYETVTENGATFLRVKEGVTKLDGTALTENDLEEFKMTVMKVNAMMNGSLKDTDKGVIQGSCLGKLAMQFRQWMPEHYYRRFARPYYNAQLGEMREGFYNTLWKFGIDSLKDIKRMKFSFITNYHSLSIAEKANVKKALAEMTFFWVLTIMLGSMGNVDDKKGLWGQRMLLYQLKRLKLDIGASTISPDIFTNAMTILQSPMAAVKTFNNLGDLIQFNNLGHEITTGRYKGWSEYYRDFIEILPLYNQYRRIFDLSTENYMFKILDT